MASLEQLRDEHQIELKQAVEFEQRARFDANRRLREIEDDMQKIAMDKARLEEDHLREVQAKRLAESRHSEVAADAARLRNDMADLQNAKDMERQAHEDIRQRHQVAEARLEQLKVDAEELRNAKAAKLRDSEQHLREALATRDHDLEECLSKLQKEYSNRRQSQEDWERRCIALSEEKSRSLDSVEQLRGALEEEQRVRADFERKHRQAMGEQQRLQEENLRINSLVIGQGVESQNERDRLALAVEQERSSFTILKMQLETVKLERDELLSKTTMHAETQHQFEDLRRRHADVEAERDGHVHEKKLLKLQIETLIAEREELVARAQVYAERERLSEELHRDSMPREQAEELRADRNRLVEECARWRSAFEEGQQKHASQLQEARSKETYRGQIEAERDQLLTDFEHMRKLLEQRNDGESAVRSALDIVTVERDRLKQELRQAKLAMEATMAERDQAQAQLKLGRDMRRMSIRRDHAGNETTREMVDLEDWVRLDRMRRIQKENGGDEQPTKLEIVEL